MSIREWLRFRRRRIVFGLSLGPAVALYLAWAAGNRVDARGREFFGRGKAIVTGLDALARALRAGDLAGAGRAYAPEYRGSSLGLLAREPVGERSGIRALRFADAATATDRGAALDEWRRYLESFSSIDALELHIHRLDGWQDKNDVDARIRFEAIGTPHGAPQPGIDRAIFRMRFARRPRGCASAAPRSSRASASISDRPQFVDVAQSRRHRLHQPVLPGLPRPSRCASA